MTNNISNSNYASIGRRFLALLLDALILLIPCALGGHLIPIIGGIAIWFLYAPILESSRIRATLGKYLVGIQVVDGLGARISLRAAVVRNLLKFASSILLFIGFFFALFTTKKQTLHDLLADTFVVYGRSEDSIGDAWVENIKGLFPTGSTVESDSSTLSQLERLQKLRDAGTLSEEEFQVQKKKILNP